MAKMNVSSGIRPDAAAVVDVEAESGRTPGVQYEYEVCEGCNRQLFYWNFKDLSDPFPGDEMWVLPAEGREIILCEDCWVGWMGSHNHKKLPEGQQMLDPLDE